MTRDPSQDKHILAFALNYYDHPGVLNLDEFHEELSQMLVFLRALKSNSNADLRPKARAMLNNVVVAFNCFGAGTQSLLFTLCDPSLWGRLMAFLSLLSRLPVAPVVLVGGEVVRVTDTPIDTDLLEILRSEIQR